MPRVSFPVDAICRRLVVLELFVDLQEAGGKLKHWGIDVCSISGLALLIAGAGVGPVCSS